MMSRTSGFFGIHPALLTPRSTGLRHFSRSHTLRSIRRRSTCNRGRGVALSAGYGSLKTCRAHTNARLQVLRAEHFTTGEVAERSTRSPQKRLSLRLLWVRIPPSPFWLRDRVKAPQSKARFVALGLRSLAIARRMEQNPLLGMRCAKRRPQQLVYNSKMRYFTLKRSATPRQTDSTLPEFIRS